MIPFPKAARLSTRKLMIGSSLSMGGDSPIVVQTMCNTHTNDIASCVQQCRRLYENGAQLIRLTVPSLDDVNNLASIKAELRARGIEVPLVADVHFLSKIAIESAKVVEKVRINPGNFNKDHEKAKSELKTLIGVCKEHGTVLRIGINHGSLGERITSLYGNTAQGMACAAMEWLNLCVENDFRDVVVSLKASNTVVMTGAYRLLVSKMKDCGMDFPLHLGVTEAGGGDSGRIKSCVGISALLGEGIGDTIRVSLTEDPEAELPSAQYLADRYSGKIDSSLSSYEINDGIVTARYEWNGDFSRLLHDCSCDWGAALLDRRIDGIHLEGVPEDKARYLEDELMQACRRRFTHPEYIACPGCGRTMYNLQKALEDVKSKTSHFKDISIAVMGCIVNGPGEMADADWGYVGEGSGKVSIYHKKEIILRHVPEDEAVEKLVKLIESER